MAVEAVEEAEVEEEASTEAIRVLLPKSLVSFFFIFFFAHILYVNIFPEVGVFTHPCENDLVINNTARKIPFFNAVIYFENIEPLGKVDEIFGNPENSVS